MRKQILRCLIGSVMLVGAGAANATLVGASWHDDYVTKRYMNQTNETDSWTWTLGGFTPLHDLVTGYKIELRVGDDSEYDGFEYAFFNQPGSLGDKTFEVDFNNVSVGGTLAGVISLNVNGKMSASLKRKSGDFYFYGASIWAKGLTKPTAVPEPGTLGLLALGLVGLGLSRRLRKA